MHAGLGPSSNVSASSPGASGAISVLPKILRLRFHRSVSEPASRQAKRGTSA